MLTHSQRYPFSKCPLALGTKVNSIETLKIMGDHHVRFGLGLDRRGWHGFERWNGRNEGALLQAALSFGNI